MGSALVPGQVFAGYRIERLLGAGGMGEVYLAHDRDLPRHIALKVLTRAVGEDGDVRRRFQREADLVARLSHPNIVTIHARGEDHGLLWISMAYVDGSDLGAVLAAGPLAPERAVRVLAAAADALDHAHDSGVVHRDVKPANILLTRKAPERVLLSDFGIAKSLEDSVALTRTNEVYASFQYTAPERLDFDVAVDRRADVYSLGCTFYHMLTGEIPYPGSNAAQLIHGHLYRPVPRPSERNPALPSAFDAVIARALAKAPEDRHADCAQLAGAVLDAWHGGASPPAPFPRTPVPVLDTRPSEVFGTYPPTVADSGRAPVADSGHVPVADSGSGTGDLGLGSRRRIPVLIAGAVAVLLVLGAAVFGVVRALDDPPAAVPAAMDQQPLVGTWQGVARQDDAGVVSQYRMTITLRSGGVGTVVGTVRYEVPGGDCSGELTLRQQAADGTSASYFEKIRSGPCVPNGNVTVTAASDGALDFAYTGVTSAGVAEKVTATLPRVA